MLHAAPTSETKAETAQSKTQVVPQAERELHPRLLSAAGLYSPGGMSGVASGTSPEVQRRQAFAGMQSTRGNQAVLRMLHSPQQVARMPALRPSQSIMVQRKCACGGTPESTGECAECKAKHEAAEEMEEMRPEPISQPVAPALQFDFSRIPLMAPMIQRKPTVSSPGDLFEREADDVAEKVLRMAEPMPTGLAPAAIQRKCAECEEEEKKPIQTKPAPSAHTGAALDAGAAVRATERGGAPLSKEARSYFEPRFGHDFSRVRVHADGQAADAARAVRARAYTIGQDIVFGTGEYAPTTVEGKRLLAHELVHIVQQTTDPSIPGVPALQRAELKDIQKKTGSEPQVQLKEDAKPDAGQVEPPKAEKPKEEKPKEEKKDCEKNPLVESWGQETCCSRWGFIDNEAVDKKTGKTMSSCNKWPLFLALHAKEHGLEGVASCKHSKLGQKAQIKVGGNTLTVGCIDTRINEENKIEIDFEAAQAFFGKKAKGGLLEHADEVCYGDSFDVPDDCTKFNTTCHEFPKETWCLPVGVTKKEMDSPAKHGWPVK